MSDKPDLAPVSYAAMLYDLIDRHMQHTGCPPSCIYANPDFRHALEAELHTPCAGGTGSDFRFYNIQVYGDLPTSHTLLICRA